MNQNVLKTVEDVNRIKSKLKAEEEFAIIEWLTPINYGSQHSLYRNRREPGTGGWFLDSIEYHEWLTGARQVLFCQGIPGAGQSVLSALVTENISRDFA